jgi:hypothetical protein
LTRLIQVSLAVDAGRECDPQSCLLNAWFV